MSAEQPFDQWAIVELMGHVTMGGRVTEEQRFGATMGRVDVPGAGDAFTTVYFGGASVYRLTPTTETIARKVAEQSRMSTPHAWSPHCRALESVWSNDPPDRDDDEDDENDYR